MSWRGLRYKGTERLTSREWNANVDALNDLYGIVTSGTNDINVDEIYGNAGYFNNALYVAGKQVIKDGDPVGIYQLFDQAIQGIKQAVDNSLAGQYAPDLDLITQYIKDTRNTAVKLTFSVYGNLGVKIAEPVDAYGRTLVAPPSELVNELQSVSVNEAITAANNTSGFSVVLNKGGRPNVNVYYSLGGAGNVYVKVSRDGATWRTLKTYTLTASGSGMDVLQGIAYPYVMLQTDATGLDAELEIVASR
jgi:hypothetical protein